jgi:cytochrome d ubiquinol oxidase subunit I
VKPFEVLFNPATGYEFFHMWLAAYMVTGFLIASVYAVGMLRGRRDRRHHLGLLIPLTMGAVAAPVQVGVGDWIAKTVAENQPAKLAAMEGLYETRTGAPLSVGGLFYDHRMHFALEIPRGLSLLIHHNPNGVVLGLQEFPPDERPPVNVVHLAFDTMVGLGSALLLVALVLGLSWVRHRRIPGTPWFLRAVAVSGVAAIVALEAGWVTTEVGRQPWIVYRIMRTAEAVSPAPGLFLGFYAVVVIYLLLTALTVFVLRRLARSSSTPAPQEVDAQPPDHDAGEMAVR